MSEQPVTGGVIYWLQRLEAAMAQVVEAGADDFSAVFWVEEAKKALLSRDIHRMQRIEYRLVRILDRILSLQVSGEIE